MNYELIIYLGDKSILCGNNLFFQLTCASSLMETFKVIIATGSCFTRSDVSAYNYNILFISLNTKVWL
jgi:hypothetical protein